MAAKIKEYWPTVCSMLAKNELNMEKIPEPVLRRYIRVNSDVMKEKTLSEHLVHLENMGYIKLNANGSVKILKI